MFEDFEIEAMASDGIYASVSCEKFIQDELSD